MEGTNLAIGEISRTLELDGLSVHADKELVTIQLVSERLEVLIAGWFRLWLQFVF